MVLILKARQANYPYASKEFRRLLALGDREC